MEGVTNKVQKLMALKEYSEESVKRLENVTPLQLVETILELISQDKDLKTVGMVMNCTDHILGWYFENQIKQENILHILLEIIEYLFDSLLDYIKTNMTPLVYELYQELTSIIQDVAEKNETGFKFIIDKILRKLISCMTDEFIPVETYMVSVKNVNFLINNMDRVQRHQLQKEMSEEILQKMISALNWCGDFDTQMSYLECLFRLITKEKLKKCSRDWFTNSTNYSFFCDITGSDFDVNCRKFLNNFNQICKVQKVYSFVCAKIILNGNRNLEPPSTNNYNYWVDFNSTTNRITAYCKSVSQPKNDLWDLLAISKNDVHLPVHVVRVYDKVAELRLRIKMNSRGMFPELFNISRGFKTTMVNVIFRNEHYHLMKAIHLVFHKVKEEFSDEYLKNQSDTSIKTSIPEEEMVPICYMIPETQFVSLNNAIPETQNITGSIGKSKKKTVPKRSCKEDNSHRKKQRLSQSESNNIQMNEQRRYPSRQTQKVNYADMDTNSCESTSEEETKKRISEKSDYSKVKKSQFGKKEIQKENGKSRKYLGNSERKNKCLEKSQSHKIKAINIEQIGITLPVRKISITSSAINKDTQKVLSNNQNAEAMQKNYTKNDVLSNESETTKKVYEEKSSKMFVNNAGITKLNRKEETHKTHVQDESLFQNRSSISKMEGEERLKDINRMFDNLLTSVKFCDLSTLSKASSHCSEKSTNEVRKEVRNLNDQSPVNDLGSENINTIKRRDEPLRINEIKNNNLDNSKKHISWKEEMELESKLHDSMNSISPDCNGKDRHSVTNASIHVVNKTTPANNPDSTLKNVLQESNQKNANLEGTYKTKGSKSVNEFDIAQVKDMLSPIQSFKVFKSKNYQTVKNSDISLDTKCKQSFSATERRTRNPGSPNVSFTNSYNVSHHHTIRNYKNRKISEQCLSPVQEDAAGELESELNEYSDEPPAQYKKNNAEPVLVGNGNSDGNEKDDQSSEVSWLMKSPKKRPLLKEYKHYKSTIPSRKHFKVFELTSPESEETASKALKKNKKKLPDQKGLPTSPAFSYVSSDSWDPLGGIISANRGSESKNDTLLVNDVNQQMEIEDFGKKADEASKPCSSVRDENLESETVIAISDALDSVNETEVSSSKDSNSLHQKFETRFCLQNKERSSLQYSDEDFSKLMFSPMINMLTSTPTHHVRQRMPFNFEIHQEVKLSRPAKISNVDSDDIENEKEIVNHFVQKKMYFYPYSVHPKKPLETTELSETLDVPDENFLSDVHVSTQNCNFSSPKNPSHHMDMLKKNLSEAKDTKQENNGSRNLFERMNSEFSYFLKGPKDAIKSDKLVEENPFLSIINWSFVEDKKKCIESKNSEYSSNKLKNVSYDKIKKNDAKKNLSSLNLMSMTLKENNDEEKSSSASLTTSDTNDENDSKDSKEDYVGNIYRRSPRNRTRRTWSSASQLKLAAMSFRKIYLEIRQKITKIIDDYQTSFLNEVKEELESKKHFSKHDTIFSAHKDNINLLKKFIIKEAKSLSDYKDMLQKQVSRLEEQREIIDQRLQEINKLRTLLEKQQTLYKERTIGKTGVSENLKKKLALITEEFLQRMIAVETQTLKLNIPSVSTLSGGADESEAEEFEASSLFA